MSTLACLYSFFHQIGMLQNESPMDGAFTAVHQNMITIMGNGQDMTGRKMTFECKGYRVDPRVTTIRHSHSLPCRKKIPGGPSGAWHFSGNSFFTDPVSQHCPISLCHSYHHAITVPSFLLAHSNSGFTRIAVNFKFHSWFRNYKLN